MRILLTFCLFLSVNSNSQIWSPLGQGTNGIVTALYADDVNNELIIGGAFQTPYLGICKWNGLSYSSLGSGILGNAVYCIKPYNGDLIVCGDFHTAGGISVNNIAKWNGIQWLPMGNGFNGTDAYVFDLEIFNGELYAAGSFTTPIGNVAKWNGIDWVSINADADGAVQDLKTFGNELILTGEFDTIAGIPASKAARYDGNNFSSFSSDIFDDQIIGHGLASDGNEILMTGDFTTINTVDYNHVALWDGDSYNQLSTGVDARVHCSEFYNGKYVIGGDFVVAGGNIINHVALWNGIEWESLGDGLYDFPYVFATLNGELYAGGAFQLVNGSATNANFIAKWTPADLKVEESNTNSLKIYPVPTRTILNIDYINIELATIKVIDQSGKLIMTSKGQKSLDVSKIPKGIYSLEITDGESTLKERFTIE